MKKKLLSLLLVLAMVLSMVPMALAAGTTKTMSSLTSDDGATFTAAAEGDTVTIKDHWGLDAIQYVYDNGLMNGMKADQFGPDGQLDRSQLVTILRRMEGSPKGVKGKQFADVSAAASNTAWFYDAVSWASANGIVNGKTETAFDPFARITREQAAAMFHRYAAFKEKDSDDRSDLSKFTEDVNKVSAWAKDDIAWANAVGLINGQSATKLAPLDGATRTEAATILMRFCEQILK